jgi:hypothetical protein
MKQVNIRKYLSVLGLALVMGATMLGVIVHDAAPAPYPPGPTIIAIL